MSPKDNLISLLKRQGFESVPAEFNLCPSLEVQFHEKERTDKTYFEYFEMPWRHVGKMVSEYQDINRFCKYFSKENLADPNFSFDANGVGHRKTASSMHMTQMINPLADADSVEQIEEYPLDFFDLQKNLQSVKAEVESAHEDGLAAVGNMQCTIWESAWYIRGMENLMMDMMSDGPMATAILDKALKMSLTRALVFANAGVDILFLGDDIGMQKSIMMSQTLYSEWIMPRLRKVISEVKKVNPQIIVFYHSCGYIEPFIPTLIEVGIDVLNPVQPECMSFEKLHAQYGEVLSFHGTIGTQSTMPFGSVEDVRREVERNLKIAGDKGGLWPAPTHLLEPEVPWENVKAYVDACRSFCGIGK